MLEEVLLLHEFAKGCVGESERCRPAELCPGRGKKRNGHRKEALCSVLKEKCQRCEAKMRSIHRFHKQQTSVFGVSVCKKFFPIQNVKVGAVSLCGRVSGTAGLLAVFSRLNHSSPRKARHNLRRND